MPAANSAGNTMISHTGIPSPACVPEMPTRPISLAVSKLSPNKKPSGSMCQSFVTRPNTGGANDRADIVPGGQERAETRRQRVGCCRNCKRRQKQDEGVTTREPETDACRTLTLLHELAGDVVDGGDVIGIDGVAQT